MLRPGGRAVVVDLLRHDREDFRERMGQQWLGFDRERAERRSRRPRVLRVRSCRELAPEPGTEGPALVRGGGGAPARPPGKTGVRKPVDEENAMTTTMTTPAGQGRPSSTRWPTSASPSGAARRSTLAEQEMPGLMAVRQEYAAAQPLEGPAHHRQPAHDDPDRGADRDAEGARGRGALGSCNIFSTQDHAAAAVVVGPKGTPEKPAGRARLRLEGREPRGVLGPHRARARLRRRPRPHPDRGRRRRRHAAHPQGPRVREGGQGARSRDRGQRGVRDRAAPARPAAEGDSRAAGRRSPRSARA